MFALLDKAEAEGTKPPRPLLEDLDILSFEPARDDLPDIAEMKRVSINRGNVGSL